ncbi:polyphosphate kinase [Yersinia aleksiciae]|uniref:polyphosphate kinase n=1 Tax=Yersinia aleksiciae TaxID=263819 RepID=UPI0021BD6254|nr:polyphosphate kinase [Yersinia aleksiciae]
MLSKEEVDRQDFETWYTNIWHPLNMKRNRFGNYIATDHTMAWEGWQARNAELLSLRERVAILELESTYSGMTAQERVAHGRGVAEQLEALKQQKPIGQVISCNDNKTLGWINDAPEGTLLFTAAKPAEIPRHIYSMLVNELRDVPAIGCKRELIIGVLNRHGVTAEPIQFDPPATE